MSGDRVEPLALYAVTTEGEPDPDPQWLSLLNHAQVRRVLVCRHPETARQRFFAALFVRWVLSRRLGLPNGAIDIAADPWGKPFLPAFPEIHFNLSHSGGRLVVGVGSHPLGVDVERVRVVHPRMPSTFHPREQQYLKNLPAALQPDRFIDLWTRKESYLKARGMGLRRRLDSFSVVDREGRLVGRIRDPRGSWDVVAYLWDGEFRVAMAFPSGPKAPRLELVAWTTVANWAWEGLA